MARGDYHSCGTTGDWVANVWRVWKTFTTEEARLRIACKWWDAREHAFTKLDPLHRAIDERIQRARARLHKIEGPAGETAATAPRYAGWIKREAVDACPRFGNGDGVCSKEEFAKLEEWYTQPPAPDDPVLPVTIPDMYWKEWPEEVFMW